MRLLLVLFAWFGERARFLGYARYVMISFEIAEDVDGQRKVCPGVHRRVL